MIVETVEKVAPGPPSLRQAPVRFLVSRVLTVLCRELGCRAVGETCVAVLWRGQLRCPALFQIYHDTMHTVCTVPLYH